MNRYYTKLLLRTSMVMASTATTTQVFACERELHSGSQHVLLVRTGEVISERKHYESQNPKRKLDSCHTILERCGSEILEAAPFVPGEINPKICIKVLDQIRKTGNEACDCMNALESGMFGDAQKVLTDSFKEALEGLKNDLELRKTVSIRSGIINLVAIIEKFKSLLA